MAEELTQERLDSVIHNLIRDRNRFGDYEVEEVGEPLSERLFVGVSDGIVETLNDIFTFSDQEKSPSVVLERAIACLIDRCQKAKDELIQAKTLNDVAMHENHRYKALCIAVAKMRSWAGWYIPTETKTRMSEVSTLTTTRISFSR